MAEVGNGEKSAEVRTEISYCPHLGIYRYRKADGSDYMFDTDQLEKAIDAYIKSGDSRQADFMATLTGMARQYPHQVLSFDENGVCALKPLTPAELPVEGDSESPTG